MERIISSVTSVSWIPSEAMTGPLRLPMDLGIGHYDDPLPERIDDLEAMRAADRFRFANVLRAYIDVEDGEIVAHGHLGGGIIGATTVRLGPFAVTIAAVPYRDLRSEPEYGDGWVRFRQTAGGRTGAPLPRRVSRPPYVRMVAPSSWTTLELTLHTDGRTEFAVVGASRFPRHWIYDDTGQLVAKNGLVDFTGWKDQFAGETPWGEADSPAMITAVETALERELSLTIMRGGSKPRIQKLLGGEVLVEQGEESTELFLILDGILDVQVDGRHLGELGPGAIVGERAILEGGRRTATLVARTPCKLAVAAPDQIEREHLQTLAAGHRREVGAGATVGRD